MGTRHLIEVVHNGEIKVAQYGQWDGYPSGQGVDILKFLHNHDLAVFATKVDGCTFINRDKIRQYYVDAGDSPENKSGFISIEISNKFKEMHPALSRDAGAEVLSMIYDSENGIELSDSRDFANDTLFCEYAYVIDLDSNTFVCYATGKTNKIYECSLLELPDEETFLKSCKTNDEDEEEGVE